MSGWDKDQRGDYTPPALPAWTWVAGILVILGFIALAIFAG